MKMAVQEFIYFARGPKTLRLQGGGGGGTGATPSPQKTF
jgi:hypothetical protein